MGPAAGFAAGSVRRFLRKGSGSEEKKKML